MGRERVGNSNSNMDDRLHFFCNTVYVQIVYYHPRNKVKRSDNVFTVIVTCRKRSFGKYVGQLVCLSVSLSVCHSVPDSHADGPYSITITITWLCAEWCQFARNWFWWLKVKGQGQGHRKGQNHIICHNFGSISPIDFKLILWYSIWLSGHSVTLTLAFDLDLIFQRSRSIQVK